MKIINTFCLILLTSMCLNGQEKIRLYFTKEWEVTSKDKAVCYRDAEYDMKNYRLNGKVRDFDLKGNLLMEGNYLQGKRNGEFVFYYSNGKIESKGAYRNNNRSGMWFYYYPTGHLKQDVRYTAVWMKAGKRIGEQYAYDGKQLVNKGKGRWIEDSIKIGDSGNEEYFRMTGKVRDSLITGVWKLRRISDNKLFGREEYRKGVKMLVLNGYSGRTSNSRLGQRIRDEMRTGVSHENLVGENKESWEPGSVNSRVWEQEKRIATQGSRGTVILPQSEASNMLHNQKSGVSSMDIGLGLLRSISRNMELIPDQNLRKLVKTEKLIPDTDVFPETMEGASFFRMISQMN